MTTYLGDGLYATFDGHQIELYASNGLYKTNRVFLDGSTLAAFLIYVEQEACQLITHDLNES